MAKVETVLEKMNEICLSLPDTELSMSWGHPHYKVGKKIFAACDDKPGKMYIYFALEPEHTDLLLATDPRFERTRYAGALQLAADAVKSWDELKKLMLESYKLRATKKSLAKLSGAPAAPPKKKAKTAAKAKPKAKPRSKPKSK